MTPDLLGAGGKPRVHRNNTTGRLVPGRLNSREPLWFWHVRFACCRERSGIANRPTWRCNEDMKRADPYLRAGYDDLVREWLRLAEQAKWIENQQQPPPAKRITRRNRTE